MNIDRRKLRKSLGTRHSRREGTKRKGNTKPTNTPCRLKMKTLIGQIERGEKNYREIVGEAGFVLIALFALLLPLFVLVAAVAQTMHGRNSALLAGIAEEKSFWAAESGIDHALYLLSNGKLAATQQDMGQGQSYEFSFIDYSSDLVDNNDNGQVDEPDENLFEITVTGRYRNAVTRLMAYLAPKLVIPEIKASVSLQNPSVMFMPKSHSTEVMISGYDAEASDVYGVTVNGIDNPDFLGSFSDVQQDQIVGAGGLPSIAFQEEEIDLAAIVDSAELNADLILASSNYKDVLWGTDDDPKVIFRNGDLSVAGISDSAGILVVTGNLQLKDFFEFHGVIVVLGNVNLKDEMAELENGNATITGGIIQGDNATKFKLKGQNTISYSAKFVEMARNLLPGDKYRLSGWRVLSDQ